MGSFIWGGLSLLFYLRGQEGTEGLGPTRQESSFNAPPSSILKSAAKKAWGNCFDCGVREEKIGLDSVSLLTDLSELEGVMKSSAK